MTTPFSTLDTSGQVPVLADSAICRPPLALVMSACADRRATLCAYVCSDRHTIDSLSSLEQLRQEERNVSILIMELELVDADGIEVIRYLGQQISPPELIIISDMDARVVAAATRLAQAKGLIVRGTLPRQPTAEALNNAMRDMHSIGHADRRSPIVMTDHHHLRRGLANDEFVVFFQPKINVETLELVSVESLVRWRHPEYGMLGPNSFVDLAERTGLIVPLTDAIIENAFCHAGHWQESGVPLKVAINVSVASLADLTLPDQLFASAQKFALPPDSIVIEITESWVEQNAIDALDILTRLRMKGFNLSIDDFGTGYSTMLKLKQIPFSELKLDQSIIRGAANDADARTIVETSIDLGHRLGLHLVAEGIERQDDWDLISELGCNEGQGYFIARPMTAAELPDWRSHWNRSLGIAE